MLNMKLVLAAAALTTASAVYAASTPAPPTAPTTPPAPPTSHTTAPAPAATTAPTHAATDYKAHCTALEGQWETTLAAQAANPNLGKAKSKAAKAKTSCASSKPADQKKGVAGYESALKLLGAKPS